VRSLFNDSNPYAPATTPPFIKRIIFGLVMLWAALFGACQASAYYNSHDSNYNVAIPSGTSPVYSNATSAANGGAPAPR